MKKFFDYIKSAISPEKDVSAKRLIAVWFTLIGTVVDLTIVLLIVVIFLNKYTTQDVEMVKSIADKLLLLSVIQKLSTMIMMAVVTLQDVRGLALGVRGVDVTTKVSQTVELSASVPPQGGESPPHE